MTDTSDDPIVVARRIRQFTGFDSAERDWVTSRLAALAPRLRSFPHGHVELEVSLKDRDGAGQQVMLECWIHRHTRLHLVAKSSARELVVALNEVRNNLMRQIDDTQTRTEPN